MKKLIVVMLTTLMLVSLFSVIGCARKTSTSTSEGEKTTLRISAGLSKTHFWVGNYMDIFADQIEQETGKKVEFKRYYAGELVKVGRELDALKGSTIDVAVPFLAPYHEGLFPLSDVTQLPLIDTNSTLITKAFQNLMDSKVQLKDGKTFYDYEIVSKGLVAWPLGATEKYALSTTGKKFDSVKSFSGTPLRAGSTLGMMALESLGATAVYMPSADSYEAMSKGTVNGLISSIGDWKSYGFQDLIKYTITGANMGHWESYLTLTKATWDKLPADVQKTWDKTARELALKNAQYITSLDDTQIAESKQKGAVFQDISTLDPEVKAYFNKASTDTWVKWITKVEKEGHPGKATAKLWAESIIKEGGKLPDGVAKYLGI